MGGITFDAGEHYVKQSFRNRYHILTANGVSALSVPVKRIGADFSSTAQVCIEHQKPWLRAHLRSIQAAYGKAPFYPHFVDEVRALLSCPAKNIGDFFSQTFEKWCALLGVNISYEVSQNYLEEAFTVDLRMKIKQPSQFPDEGQSSAYVQVFEDRFGFSPNLSVIDLLFNEGPASGDLLTT